MRRIHAIELHEQPWCPGPIRDAATDYLQYVARLGNAYSGIVRPLSRALERAGTREILDLCSGGGGPWLRLREALAAELGEPVRVRLSDLHPNQPAFAHARAQSNAHICYEEQPVSAANVPAELSGFRTLFAAFHHFPPASARAVLRDAVRRGRGIGVFEPIERSVPNMLGMLLAPIVCLALTPLIRPFRWSRLLLTYLVPIVPLVILFDGVVSCLRTYTPDELRALVAELGPAPYAWEIGTARMPASPVALTFLIGTPSER